MGFILMPLTFFKWEIFRETKINNFFHKIFSKYQAMEEHRQKLILKNTVLFYVFSPSSESMLFVDRIGQNFVTCQIKIWTLSWQL